MEIEKHLEREKLLTIEAQGIADDNTRLVKENNLLRSMNSQLQTEVVNLKENNKSLASECTNLKTKYRNIEITY